MVSGGKFSSWVGTMLSCFPYISHIRPFVVNLQGDGSSAGRDPLASGRGQSQGRKRKRRKTSTSSSSTQLPRKPVQRVRVLSYVGSSSSQGLPGAVRIRPRDSAPTKTWTRFVRCCSLYGHFNNGIFTPKLEYCEYSEDHPTVATRKSIWLILDNFLMAFISTCQSKCKT